MFQDLINEALETGRSYIKEGEVATYIPAGIRRTGSASRVFRRLSALQ